MRKTLGVLTSLILIIGLSLTALAHHKPGHRVPPGLATTTSSVTTAPTTTPTTSPTTTPTTSPSQCDARVSGNASIQNAINAQPAGAVICLSGTFFGQTAAPKANQTLIGPATLDGNGAGGAIVSGADGVKILNLEITDYQPAERVAVVRNIPGGQDWLVQDNHIHHNGEIGVKMASGWVLRDNHIHHNGRYGITGSGFGLVVEGNEISFNANVEGASGDSSGTKWVHTTNLVLHNNYAHDNFGNGLWVDINNVDALIEGNRTVNNTRAGIFLEISCGGVVRNNLVKGNGSEQRNPNWMAGSTGIQVANTPNVEIYNNTVINNFKGIGAIHWAHPNRDAVTKCVPALKNLSVHHNTVIQSGGAAAGVDASADQNLVWGSWNNRFWDNSYTLSNNARFRWRAQWLTYPQWLNHHPND